MSTYVKVSKKQEKMILPSNQRSIPRLRIRGEVSKEETQKIGFCCKVLNLLSNKVE